MQRFLAEAHAVAASCMSAICVVVAYKKTAATGVRLRRLMRSLKLSVQSGRVGSEEVGKALEMTNFAYQKILAQCQNSFAELVLHVIDIDFRGDSSAEG